MQNKLTKRTKRRVNKSLKKRSVKKNKSIRKIKKGGSLGKPKPEPKPSKPQISKQRYAIRKPTTVYSNKDFRRTLKQKKKSSI